MAELKNQKHEAFCQEFIIDFNGTKAAIRAGYSEKTAVVQASRLLTNANICARIAELQTKRSEQTGIDAAWVLMSAKQLFDRCMQAEPVMIRTENGMEPSGEYKFDSAGANKALDTIGKHVDVQAFLAKVDHSSKDGSMSPISDLNISVVRPKKK